MPQSEGKIETGSQAGPEDRPRRYCLHSLRPDFCGRPGGVDFVSGVGFTTDAKVAADLLRQRLATRDIWGDQ